uniref:Uncharacterized protein n=1 Tax=Arundo donax TaxID=35708 RepID=A0A0A8Y4H3_ARUDO
MSGRGIFSPAQAPELVATARSPASSSSLQLLVSASLDLPLLVGLKLWPARHPPPAC